MKKLMYLLPLLFLALPIHAQALAAFPGAQGGGALSLGGRGGVVYEVTTTNDSGGGSLRNCVMATGPRNCIFQLAGIFNIASDLRPTSPFLTIACQTAPGEVILGGPKAGGMLTGVTTHDVIIRGCVYSPDNASTPSGPDTGTTSVNVVNCPGVSPSVPANANAGCFDIILDSVTTRWSGNKSFITTSNFTPGKGTNGNGTGPNHAITVQYSLDYEPAQGHPVGFGTATDESCIGTRQGQQCLSYLEVDIDFHHSMFVNIHHRIPENSNGSTRWVNNIIFNWGWYANEFLGAEIIDARNNKYAPGSLNQLGGAQKYPIHFTTNSPEMSGPPSVFVDGNVLGGYGQNTPAADQYGTLVNQITGENGNETGPIPDSWKRSAPMADTKFPITVEPVAQLDADLLANVGAWWHLDCLGNKVSHRDPQDARILNQYKTGGPGGYWPNGVTYTGQPTIPTPLPNWTDTPVINGTLCAESLHDGIPDQWKAANHLSTTDPNLYKTPSPSGYTWLEVYLAGSSVVPPPVNPVSPNGATITPTSGGSLTDASQNTWTLGAVVPPSTNPDCAPASCGNTIILNGNALAGSAANLLLWYNASIYQSNAAGLWWQYVNGSFKKVGGDPRPPVVHPTVTCAPTSITINGTSQCTANQAVTWSTSVGTITAAGLYTAPNTPTTATITGTNTNGSGSVPVTVTAITPPPNTFMLTCTKGPNGTVICTGTIPAQ